MSKKPTPKDAKEKAPAKPAAKPAAKKAPAAAKPAPAKITAAPPVVKESAPKKAPAKKEPAKVVEKKAPAPAPKAKPAPAKKPAAKTTPEKPAPAKKAAPAKAPQKPAKKAAASKAKPVEKPRSEQLKKLLSLREQTKSIKKIKKTEPATKPAPKQPTPTPAQAAEQAAQAAAKKKRRRKAPYTKAELKALRQILEDEREQLLKDLRELDDMAESNRQTTHATFSSHQADAASDSSALENTYIQRRYEEERFAQVSEALIKLDEGNFGLCEMCIDEPQDLCATCPYIPLDRLHAKPFARLCVQLRIEMEKRNRR